MEQHIEKISTMRRGQRMFIEGLSQEAFQAGAKKLAETMKKQGVDIGFVYHAPVALGIIFVK